MECEFSVELAKDDPTLAVPWRSPDGKIAFLDLRVHPEQIARLSEVKEFPELGELLRTLNSGGFATAKCDAWFDTLMDVDDEPYGATLKCGSYVDLFFHGAHILAAFAEHERAARDVVKRVRAAEDLRARAEVAVRRAYFEKGEGFYWTVYVFGYGESRREARAEWAKALKTLASNVPS